MGDSVGVFDNKEVEELDETERSLLKEHIIHHIVTSQEIRRIITSNPKLLTSNPDIRDILRKKARRLHRHLTKK